jgi:hypothetical protein
MIPSGRELSQRDFSADIAGDDEEFRKSGTTVDGTLESLNTSSEQAHKDMESLTL